MDSALILTVFQILILMYSVVLHELAHGYMARSMGDLTAERMGRLTLNPIAHLDMFGSVILPLITKFVGGFMFGYAKPVPYDPNSLNDKRFGPAKVALAGPAVNFTLAIMAGALIRYLGTDISPLFSNMLAYVVWINLILGLFNLIPVPPLDGHWLLMTFLPASWYGLKIALYRYQLILIALVIFYVFPALNPLMNSLFTLLTGYRLF